MKSFIPISNNNFTFDSCSNCNANCCDGRKGTIYSQVLKEEFEKTYKNFPILFIFGELGFCKPVILLTNGKEFCFYQQNHMCSIYEDRPTVCRTYPLSPNLDNQIYIDITCPEVNKGKEFLIKNQKINMNSYKNSIFDNYQDKYIETHFEFETLDKKDFKEAITINDVIFYKYIGDEDSLYVNLHKKSLKNLQKYL